MEGTNAIMALLEQAGEKELRMIYLFIYHLLHG